MKNIFLQIYYCLLLYVLITQCHFFFNNPPSELPEYVMFAYPLKFLNLPIGIHFIFFCFALFFCLSCIFYPSKYLKITTSILFLIVFSIKFSYGKINHHFHSWMLSSILMCFLSCDKKLTSQTNLLVLRLTQSILLSHYFISGLWKLRSLVSTKFQFSFKEILSEHIIYGITQQGGEISEPLNFLLFQYPELLSAGFLCVLLFQISALVPVFFNQLFLFYGILAILFHISTGIALGFCYTPTVLAILLFLVIAEIIIKDEKITKKV